MKILYILVLLINIIYSLQLNVLDIKFAQTHVIPIDGKYWNLNNKTHVLRIVPNRDSLLLAKFGNQSDQYTVTAYHDNQIEIGSLLMKLPKDLPPTEDSGPKYSSEYHSVIIPATWIKKNLKLKFTSTTNKQVSQLIQPNIGQERTLKLWTLPFYLFGANDSNTQPFSAIKQIDKQINDELVQKWSISNLLSLNHPIGKIEWSYLVMGPRNGYPAMRITNSDQKTDGYAIMATVLSLLGLIRNVYGESSSSNQIYAPLLHLDKTGKYSDPYGGLGGGKVGTGDYRYTGIFIHEMGHSFSIPHVGDAYNSGTYPYVNGSLKGSEWGFDALRNEFLSIYIPKSADNYYKCENRYVMSDDKKNCIKQSVMQGGAGCQSSSYRFSMFSDYEMLMIQNYFENALFYEDTTGQYKKWNVTSQEYYQYLPTTSNNGLWGINDGLPIERDIEIYTIIFTYSTVGPNQVNQFYPPLRSIGNIVKYFDPTNKTEIKDVVPNISKYAWYCQGSGCDYTIRITFKDKSTQHILLQQGNRKWFSSTSDNFKTGLYDSKSSDSFIQYAVNIKSNKDIQKLELLDTPMGYNGLNNSSLKVLISKSF